MDVPDEAGVRRALRDAVAARLDDVVVEVAEMMVHDLEGYSDVPPGELRAAVRRSLLDIVEGVTRPGGEPAAVAWAIEVARSRAAEGVPVESVVAAYAEGNQILWRVLLEEAARQQVPPVLLLDLARERWAGSDRVQREVVQAHREEDLARVRRHALRRTALLRRLLRPTPEERPSAPDDLAEALRLPRDRPLYCLRARGLPGRDLESSRGVLIVDELDGHPVALSLRPPPPREYGVVGYDGPCRLAQLPEAYDAAERTAAVAARSGLTGSFTLADVALEAVVLDEPALGEVLAVRYVRPLEELPQGADVLLTVWTHLRLGQSVDRTAAQLFVHANTVRNRLSRYNQATDADLRDPATALRVAWALRHRQQHGEPGPW